MRPLGRVVGGSLLAILLAAARAVSQDVTVGFGGVHRTGAWTPVVISVPVANDPLDGEWYVRVQDPDGQWVRSPAPTTTSGTAARRLRFRVRFGRPEAGIEVEQPAASAVDRQSFALPPAQPAGEPTILVIGDLDPAERAARLMAREDGVRPRVIRCACPRELAAGARGMTARDLDGVDVIVACGDALADGDDDVSQDALAAIDGWVRQGGTLVYIAGESAARGAGPATWLPGPPGTPGRVERLVPLRRSAAIEAFGRAARPLDKAALSGLQAPVLADAARLDGTILAFEGRAAADLPLVVRSVRGFGTITWLGLDLDRPAFRSWPGTETLLVELIGGRAVQAEAGRGADANRSVVDLAGQLRAAIDRFPGVAAVPFEVIAALGMLYVACLYPLDWWLTSRGGDRAAMAWISLPVIVASFSGLAWIAGRHWKGDAWRSSAAGIVDVDVVTGSVRGRSWAGAWAPENATLDASVMPDGLAAGTADAAVSWCADAGRGLGASDAAAAHPALGAADYAYADGLAALVGEPIAADSSRLFEADWMATLPAAPDEAPILAKLDRDAQAALRGSIESRLPFPLEACVLAHAGWLYDVGRLAPGDRFDPGAGRGPRSLASALTHRAAARERDVAERWDSSSTDVARILEVAGFHRAAGGVAYTGLEPGRLRRLDLSPVLDTGRAVLVGSGPPGTTWNIRSPGTAEGRTIAAAAGKTGIWRFVLPLEP